MNSYYMQYNINNNKLYIFVNIFIKNVLKYVAVISLVSRSPLTHSTMCVISHVYV